MAGAAPSQRFYLERGFNGRSAGSHLAIRRNKQEHQSPAHKVDDGKGSAYAFLDQT